MYDVVYDSFSICKWIKKLEYCVRGGVVKSKETLSLSLDKLVAGGSYHRVCKITDPNNQKNKVSLVFSTFGAVMPTGTGRITLNGSEVGMGQAQVQLNNVNNIVEYFNMYQQYALAFKNLDQDDSVTVSDCVATAE